MTKFNLQSMIDKIEDATGTPGEVYDGINNDETICIEPDQLVDVINILRDHFDCIHLTAITAQQREDQQDTIEVMYHFWKGRGITLLMKLPTSTPQLTSIIDFLPGADFYEREVAEMFGIHYTGREETPPLLLPDDWQNGPPFIGREENDAE